MESFLEEKMRILRNGCKDDKAKNRRYVETILQKTAAFQSSKEADSIWAAYEFL